MIKIILVSLIFSLNAFAQAKTKVTVKPKKTAVMQTSASPTPAPLNPTGTSTAAAPAAPAPAPQPWKISYFGEYQGPTLGNFDIAKTQTPGQPQGYTEWDHYLKVGYGVSKTVTLGTQIRAFSPTDPAASFGFYDLRLFAQWSHMIETADIDMSGKVSFELPTTDASRTNGKVLALKLDENFTFKTALRNWNFSADLLIKPYFYNDPASGGVGPGKTDLVVGIFPYITMDMSPSVQLLFEGSFDTAHKYNSSTGDFLSGDPDYVDIGPLFTVNSHTAVNTALRFFTDNISFKAAALYANIEVDL